MHTRGHILSFLLLFFFTPAITHAAVADILLDPEIPGPYEEVTAKLGGFLIDTDRAEIFWYEDGQIQKQGFGERSFDFFTGGIGKQTVLDVVIITEQGLRIDKQVTVEPIELDVLWEADTYTPPFYKGKALPTYNSQITAIAIPNVPNPESTPFIYTWKDGYFNIQNDYSGYERNFYSSLAQLSPYRKTIDVEVVSADRVKRAKKQVSVYSVEPELIAYEIQPLYGTDFSKNMAAAHEITQNEVGVYIAPYYFSTQDVITEKLNYRWVGGNTTLRDSSRGEANKYFFGRPAGDAGSAKIQIFVINDNEWLQKSKKDLTLFYK